MHMHPPLKVVMAGLDPATQQPRVYAAEKLKTAGWPSEDSSDSHARTDVRALGGRVEPGHDDICVGETA
jgi:hypothetical protein